MVKESTSSAILDVFFLYPTKEWTAREIARAAKISHPSVLNYLKELKKNELICLTDTDRWKAHFSDNFKRHKKLHTIQQLFSSGLIPHLRKVLAPNVIILFGSSSKGEDIEKSDIDLFIESSKRELNLKFYEKKIGRKIEIIFGRINALDKNFLNSVINGTILFGGIEL